MECVVEERIYKIIKYQLYTLITIWKYEATVLHFLPWFSAGVCVCVCVCEWVNVCVFLSFTFLSTLYGVESELLYLVSR